MTQTCPLRSPNGIILLARSIRQHREAVDWIKALSMARLNHIDDVPIVIRGAAKQFIRAQADRLRGDDFEPFREGRRQLLAFADGYFRFSPEGARYGNGPPVRTMGVTSQILRDLRLDHLRKQVLPKVTKGLKELEAKVAEVAKPGVAVRMFSKPARVAARTIKQLERER